MNSVYNLILREFNDIVGIQWVPDIKYQTAYENLISSNSNIVLSKEFRISRVYKAVLSKFELHKPIVKSLLSELAKRKVLLNYHQKSELKDLLDERQVDPLKVFLSGLSVNNIDSLLKSINFLSNKEVIQCLSDIISDTGKGEEILESIFSYYLFHSVPIEIAHKVQTNEELYNTKYFDYLQTINDCKLERKLSLVIIEITKELVSKFGDESKLLAYINTLTKEYYNKIDNHCYFGVYYNKCAPWSIISDNVIYAEKHVEEELVKGYFHPSKIEESTKSYIKNINVFEARFGIANSGFTYKDTFIIEDKQDNRSYSSMVLFEKNERDETLIPCPACRTKKVRGNSYPILGVRSWECHNEICPDKSKYNRGKRYSLSSIIRQEAILDERNKISSEEIGEWRLDKVVNKSKNDLFGYIIKAYSLHGDNVEIVNGRKGKKTINERIVTYLPHDINVNIEINNFYDSSYFKRYVIKSEIQSSEGYTSRAIDNLNFLHGDSHAVLITFEDEFFDASVTSPPYYNAREYSQWDNIYCYLHDMYNNTLEVFRTLKPGGIYLYNIFDYFDNERNVVFSAMGKKRMILGPYIVNMFERIGFKVERNIIWYKGHIQGNRSFNQGNFVPYYQAPLNCYEYIYVFRKPGSPLEIRELPDILEARPVHKMVRGENVLGHTAPFPFDIPNILFDSFAEGSRILDPYAGSFSTLRARGNRKFEVYGIEKNLEYYQLGIDLYKQTNFNSQFDFSNDD